MLTLIRPSSSLLGRDVRAALRRRVYPGREGRGLPSGVSELYADLASYRDSQALLIRRWKGKNGTKRNEPWPWTKVTIRFMGAMCCNYNPKLNIYLRRDEKNRSAPCRPRCQRPQA